MSKEIFLCTCIIISKFDYFSLESFLLKHFKLHYICGFLWDDHHFWCDFCFLTEVKQDLGKQCIIYWNKNIKRKQCWISFSLLNNYHAQNKMFLFISTQLRNCSYLVIRNGKRLIKHQGNFIQRNQCCYKDQYAQKWKGLFQSAKIRAHCLFQALVPILFDHRCSKSMGIGLPSVTVK